MGALETGAKVTFKVDDSKAVELPKDFLPKDGA
jgi:hypothetical protein